MSAPSHHARELYYLAHEIGRLATRFCAISAFSLRDDCLTGPAKVIDGDTIVVAVA